MFSYNILQTTCASYVDSKQEKKNIVVYVSNMT